VAFSTDGRTLASGSDDQPVQLWEVASGQRLRPLSGHADKVSSVAFSPDSKLLASGGLDSTARIWDIVSDAIQVSMALLPGNEWIAYHPQKLFYNSSLQGYEHAAIRFDNQLSPVYPLKYYQRELKQADLARYFLRPQPVIEPKWIRLWWDGLNKWLLFIGLPLGLLTGATGVTVAFILRKRSDPMEVAKQFFARAGFQRVEAVSHDLLLLHPRHDRIAGIVTLWQEGQSDIDKYLLATIRHQRERRMGEVKLYVIYKGQGPSSSIIHAWREQLACEIIPLLSAILQKALSTNACEGLLQELEEPYLARLDPYAELKPIHDPTWFYGRDELLKRLPAVLAQGQHVGIFGLRKVGKTSLINQLRQRFVSTPTVFIDCQAFSARAEVFFEEILKKVRAELLSHGLKGVLGIHPVSGPEGFRQQFLAFFELWEKTGQRGSFLIILDEIDKLFPNQEVKNSEEILAEYVRFFRLLRGLAQTRQCLVTLVIAYRPDVNRRNLLTPAVGENPMFQSFQEEYLGFLNSEDSEAMIREIGRWKQIKWDEDAARGAFEYCGGHPLITRLFASQACEEGRRKAIDYRRVEETAKEIETTLRRNEVGNYYKEGVWELLRDDEQQVLSLICQRSQAGFPEAQIPRYLEVALTNLENFGLVASHGGIVQLTAHLFRVWLQRRIA
jgi:WD domain, G-beta repeat/AAA domain